MSNPATPALTLDQATDLLKSFTLRGTADATLVALDQTKKGNMLVAKELVEAEAPSMLGAIAKANNASADAQKFVDTIDAVYNGALLNAKVAVNAATPNSDAVLKAEYGLLDTQLILAAASKYTQSGRKLESIADFTKLAGQEATDHLVRLAQINPATDPQHADQEWKATSAAINKSIQHIVETPTAALKTPPVSGARDNGVGTPG